MSLSCTPVISNHDESSNGTLEMKKSFVDVMFIKNHNDRMLVSAHKQLSAGYLSAAEGYTFNDPIHDSMNSLDFIYDDLVMHSICVSDTSKNKDV